MVWVRPGVLLVLASPRRPRMALMALDLPTLERPANATSGGPAGGRSAMRPAARRNTACAKPVITKARNSNKIAAFHPGESGDEARTGACGHDVGCKLGIGPGQGTGNRWSGVRCLPCC